MPFESLRASVEAGSVRLTEDHPSLKLWMTSGSPYLEWMALGESRHEPTYPEGPFLRWRTPFE